LVSDNGCNYTKMAQHFRCIYIHGTENFSLWPQLSNVSRLIERIKDGFQLIPEEYVMWLEDDVSINSVVTDTFRYDVNGFCPNAFNPGNIEALTQTYPLEQCTYRWSGHGGSVFHKNNVVSYLANKPVLDDLLSNWSQYKLISKYPQDYVISLLVNVQGGTIGPYEGHADDDVLNPSIKIQHQYKVW